MSLSLCVSSTLGNNCSGLDQLTGAAYQISRALVAFDVAEVVVLNDSQNAIVLAALLQYFITPPYLVGETFKGVELPQNVFGKAKRFQSIPNLPAFSSKDHKEGLSIEKKPTNWSKHHPEFQAKSTSGRVRPLPKAAKVTKFVQVGREECVVLSEEVELGKRVTVDVANAKVVTPNEAYGKNNVLGVYGYEVRLANKLIDVWTDTRIPGGYGASGFVSGGEFHAPSPCGLAVGPSGESKNTLLVVGQWAKLESLLQDCNLEGVGLADLFDFHTPVPNQLRVEDAVTVGLSRATV